MQIRKLIFAPFIAVAILSSQFSLTTLARSHRANGETNFTVRIENISNRDGQTLYLCARSGLYRMRLGITGIHPSEVVKR